MRQVRHTGRVHLAVAGVGEVALRYDWEAISALHSAYGREWEAEVNRIVAELDPKGLAAILAIGSAHPAEWWVERSPPFVPAARAVQEALHLAFFGPGEAKADAERPPLARRLMTLFWPPGRSGSSLAGGTSSGA